ncbi:ATP-binding protein [Streptomyces sp. NPDC127051]|uniref:ATP-binding protein n=1 Tax=Streptomyces sp. NPDC127051 TaxID=3347119 RepID=UPI003646DABC
MWSCVMELLCSSQMFFSRDLAAVAAVRVFVLETLRCWGLESRVDDVCVSASELASNAVLHTPPGRIPMRVRLSLSGGIIRLEVHDRCASLPQSVEALGDDESGRGLLVVDALSDKWGVDLARYSVGKSVWAEFSLSEGLAATPGEPL